MNSEQGRSAGAIRKSHYNHSRNTMNGDNSENIAEMDKSKNLPFNFDATIDRISKGNRVMVILRGLPGSGKSFLGKEIHGRTTDSNPKNHIFSADDFFMTKSGVYAYDPSKVSDAHQFTQNCVLLKAQEGWSPLIIDNTNVKSWELFAYVRIAVANRYHIEIMEPNTKWAKDPSLLVNLNKHNVPLDGILRMLEYWENVSLTKILTELKLDYKPPLPRTYPPIVIKSSFNTNFEDCLNLSGNASAETINWANSWQDQPSTPRIEIKERQPFSLCQPNSSEKWPQEPHEPQPINKISQPTNVVDVVSKKKGKKGKQPTQTTQQKNDKKSSQPSKMEMHKVGCPNENQNFVNIREVYENIQPAYLFDLFTKCNGDANWTVNVLIEDDNNCVDNTTIPDSELTCDCFTGDQAEYVPTYKDIHQIQEEIVQPSTSKAQATSDSLSSTIHAIKTSFKLNDDCYTTNMKKVRNWKNGIFTQDSNQEQVLVNVEVTNTYEEIPPASEAEAYNRTALRNFELANPPDPVDIYDPTSDDESSSSQMEELVEIDLGHKMIKSLDALFGCGSYTREIERNKKLTSKVFMTRSMARQMHVLWLESVYSQAEEEKLQRFKEDEEMAKKLMNHHEEYPGPAAQAQEPENLDVIMEMQSALEIYKKQIKSDFEKNQRTDIATTMKKDKLRQMFPKVDLETLMEIFVAHDYNLQETVQTLKFSLPSEMNEKINLSGSQLIAQAKEEMQKVNSGQSLDNGWTTVSKKKLPHAIQAASRLENMEKREILNNLEDLRETLEYHRNHRNVCLEKARSSIRDSKYDLATYYSNVANLHKHKLEACNLRVASCLATIHESTQSNPNMLDLHYMSLLEAVECLHMFLDKHINKLKFGKVPHKELLIITGRGNNSVGGVSHIKHKTKGILKERCLTYHEINPGLLKVKIHANSNMQSK